MIRIPCPHCGPRNASEFRHGGEVNVRPPQPTAVEDAAWTEYIYMRRNRADVQTEWWYHRHGCGTWFLVERDNRTNEVLRSYLWRPSSTQEPT